MGNIIRKNDRPEDKIQKAVIEYLTARSWHCEETHGNVYQTGLPDLYVMHTKFGKRWIDCKVKGRYSFTTAQKIKWPKWEKNGTGIWIMVGATDDEYAKLFDKPNFRDYWKKSWGELPNIDLLLEELIQEQADDYRDC